MSLAARPDVVFDRSVLASYRGPPLAAGWYCLQAQGTLQPGRSSASLALVCRQSPGSTAGARFALAPLRRNGAWSCVLALPHPCGEFDIEGSPQAMALAGLQVVPISRGSAAMRMLLGLRTRSGLPDPVGMGSVVVAGGRSLLGLQALPVGKLLATYYHRHFLPPGHHLDCRVRRHSLAGPSERVPVRAGHDPAPWFDPEGRAAWHARSEDPQLHLDGMLDRPLPGGWYLFRAKFDLIDGEISSPALYPDYGAGMDQGSVIDLPPAGPRGLVHAVVLLKRDTSALRFDPSIRPARFRVEGLALERLTRCGAALRMLLSLLRRGRRRWRELAANVRELIAVMAQSGCSQAGDALHRQYRSCLLPDQSDYTSWVRLYDSFDAAGLGLLARRAQDLADGPRVSILVPVYETPERWLRRCVESVLAQAYPNWELCLVDDASPSPHVRRILAEYAERDPRVRVEHRTSNGHISEASNTALAMARGEFVGLLDHDDELRPNALLEVVEALKRQPAARLLYSDEDKIDERGRRFEPNFKPDWNPDLLLSQNYVCHFTVVDIRLARESGGFRTGYEGSQDHDFVLRCTERLHPGEIVHIPKVLYHWRAIEGSTARRRDAKDYAADAGARAVASHLERIGARAAVEQLPHGHFRVRWPLPTPAPLVSLVIPTRDRVDLLRMCVESILRVSAYPALELLIVDNQSQRPETHRYLDGLAGEGRVRVLRFDQEFNYSAINNLAVRHARGDIIGLVNNDIEVREPGWIEELAGHAWRPGIGAVGTMLYYPDGSIQHAGVVLGVGGVANHAFARQPRGYPGHGARALVAHNLSAVTGACLFVRRELYERVGGLDESLAVAFNDIDFCLRLRELGLRNLWSPFTEIVHHESASRGSEDTASKRSRFEREVALMHHRWGDALYKDPAYNINLSLNSVNFDLAFPPRATPEAVPAEPPGADVVGPPVTAIGATPPSATPQGDSHELR